MNLFSDRQSTKADDPFEHGGRIRSFAHVEGNWATLIFADCKSPFEKQFMSNTYLMQ